MTVETQQPVAAQSRNGDSKKSHAVLVKMRSQDKLQPLATGIVEELRAAISGRVVLQGDEGYGQLRMSTWHLSIEQCPAVIVTPHHTLDVSETIKWVVKHGFEMTVAGGRHTAYFAKDDAVMLDLSAMKAIIPLPSEGLVHAQGGAKLADLDRACAPFHVAAVAGINPDTGIGGFTIGGGWGFLARQMGMAVDNLVEVECVLADGQIVIANEMENADLFWGIRGAGANFAVVTRFTYRTRKLVSCHGGLVVHPLAKANQLFAASRASMEGPRTQGLIASLGYFPPPGAAPEEARFPVAVMLPWNIGLKGTPAADVEEGRAAMDALIASIPDPVANLMSDINYWKGLQPITEPLTGPGLWYQKTIIASEFKQEFSDVLIAQFEKAPHKGCMILVMPMGGAVGDKKASDTAFAWRFKNGYWVEALSQATTEADFAAGRTWVRETFEKMVPFRAGSFANVVMAAEPGTVGDIFGPNIARLQELKARFDPTNLFCNNHNVEPEANK